MKNFYDFNLDSPQERQEREKLFPDLCKFHIALREELSEEEYSEFFRAEKESTTPLMLSNTKSLDQAWIQV